MTVAGDGEPATRLGASGDLDLVLTDVHLPRPDGIVATQRIRAALGDAAPPIVGRTASGSAEDVRRCREVGMAEVLGKPSRKVERQRLTDA